MTLIAQHGATVLPFTNARVRAPQDAGARAVAQDQAANQGPLPDNLVVLARFSRSARRSAGGFWLGGPPEGDAA